MINRWATFTTASRYIMIYGGSVQTFIATNTGRKLYYLLNINGNTIAGIKGK